MPQTHPGSFGLPATASLDLAQRLLVQELYARYNLAIDGGDIETWLDLFTADGRLEGVVSACGRDELREFATRYLDGLAREGWASVQHWNGSLVLDVANEAVHGRCYVSRLRKARYGTVTIASLSRYDDDIVLDGGTWRFACRRISG
jgi:hypothetical protein